LTPIVEVRFKGNRKEYFTWPSEDPLALHDAVIVEVERGQDLGRVSALGAVAEKKCGGCNGCSLAGSAAPPVYFTAEQRVDFRALVRDLAGLFHTRIELRQIGARDEAKRLDGVGRCGRQFCCSSWLPELRPVSLALAKDQHLSLNPSQISGGCGRLLCCLRYEHDFYVQTRKRFPKEGKVLRTGVGSERVLAVDIFRETVTLRAEDGGGDTRVVSLEKLRDEIARSGGDA